MRELGSLWVSRSNRRRGSDARVDWAHLRPTPVVDTDGIDDSGDGMYDSRERRPRVVGVSSIWTVLVVPQ